MARAGLNKHLVKQARDALRTRGQNPSLDAIRIELGNTGSKTTIHRYLKELEEEEGARLDDVSLLSETLRDMVGRLAAQLHEEARGPVVEAEARHTAQIQHLKAELQSAQHGQAQTEQALVASQSQLQAALAGRQAAAEALVEAEKTVSRQAEQIKGLQTRLEEGEAHRQSLEDKHRQARDALEHFRESAKDQRDQDQRKHDVQVQTLQAEMRQLQQTLVLKQSDITQLNRDNEGLVTERRQLQRQAGLLEQQVSQLGRALESSQAALGASQRLTEETRLELITSRALVGELQAQIQAHGSSLAG
jgi:chromosome segregation ATPase